MPTDAQILQLKTAVAKAQNDSDKILALRHMLEKMAAVIRVFIAFYFTPKLM
jgi:hypothetical protein